MDINKHVISRAISALIGRWHQRMDAWVDQSVCEITMGSLRLVLWRCCDATPPIGPGPFLLFCLFALLYYVLSYFCYFPTLLSVRLRTHMALSLLPWFCSTAPLTYLLSVLVYFPYKPYQQFRPAVPSMFPIPVLSLSTPSMSCMLLPSFSCAFSVSNS
jgi:hypothetical protein